MTRPLAVAAAIAVAVLALMACPPQNLPKPVPPAPAPSPGFTPPDDPVRAPGSGSSTGGGGATGAACTAGADCQSGICEGEGCGAGQGTCAAAKRACTYDLQTYCGCDGNTFDASGTCPERRYSHRGACQAAGSGSGTGPLPTGAPCLAASECDSGICEGKGCGADAPGKCAAATRACTRDRRTFCGCDGVTFFGSGSCPGKRYSDTAACPTK